MEEGVEPARKGTLREERGDISRALLRLKGPPKKEVKEASKPGRHG